ncbi:MAG TPA: IPT/TIG domain-containing protein, partial [Thermoanaerobaculia bacterium]|nr:IPT/TIG domain-containing protein [Thermoanaerobaculia bacterium]
TLIRTTTAGIAKATVTASSAGPVVVNATVNNVTKSITINFQDAVIPPNPTPTTPTISLVDPSFGLPTGNQTVTITGTNFRPPVRVLFDPGSGQAPKEGFVTSVTPTTITVTTPAFDLGVSQQLIVAITVIVEAGSPTEQRVTKAAAFTYTAPVLTPVFRALSPTSGSIDGGTRIVITGDAFEAPIQVFFGSAQAQVLSVTFHEIDVISPTARETNPNGSGTVTGPVDIRILNVNSGKSVSVPGAFRYINKMQITSSSPTFGSALGGTNIIIDGIGFTDGAVVDVGDVRASVIKVTGTEVTARTSPIAVPCASTGALTIKVTNIDNGDSATGGTFSYIGVPSVITSITSSGSPTVGSALTVNVQNPGVGLLGTAIIAFTVGGQPANVTPLQISTGTGSQAFTVIVPPGLTFPTGSCLVGGFPGTQQLPGNFEVRFTNTTTGCTAATTITINPTAAGAACVVPPTAAVTSPAQTCPVANLTPPSVVAAGPATQTANITITNNGTQQLVLGPPTVTPNNATLISIVPNSAQNVPGGGSANYTITLDPTAAGATGATITFTTNDPTKPTLTVTVCGNAT